MVENQGKTFSIPRDPWGIGWDIYKKSRITIRPGVTVLVGCNGAGKSTLMLHMKDALKNQGVPLLSFNNLTDGGEHARSAAGFFGDTSFLAGSIQSSEGENITMNLGRFAKKIGAFVRDHRDAAELWLFFDSVDSGYSIDNIDGFKNFLHDVVLDDVHDQSVYIVIAANAYEFTREEACFDVHGGKYVRFGDYEEYRKYVISSRKEKEMRYAVKD